MTKKEVILVVEDTPKCANWQVAAVKNIFPDKEIVHVPTLDGARQVLTNPDLDVFGVVTDNGYPITDGGERIGSKDESGGAGTLLIKLIRSGEFGEDYRKLHVVWHSADTEPEKVMKTLSADGTLMIGLTKCFKKGDGVAPYEKMVKYLKH